MSSAIVVRTAWRTLAEPELEKAYAAFNRIRSGPPAARYELESFIAAEPRDTAAESWGVYIRQRYHLYAAVLEAMKSSRVWRVLHVHANIHTGLETKRVKQPVAILGDDDVMGWHFDPVIFEFKWKDNTLNFHPYWQPWDWKLPFETDDDDDTHVFVDEESGRAFCHVGRENTLDFFGFDPAIPKLSCYPRK